MGSFKPTSVIRDIGLSVGIAGLPPMALTMGGCWKQLPTEEMTHLPISAGYKRIHTAKVGIYI